MDTGTSYVQTGWTIRTSDGHDVGTIVELSLDTIFLTADDGGRLTIPKSYIDEEDEGQQLAILSIDSEDLKEGAFSS
jgi:hypothetical protein